MKPSYRNDSSTQSQGGNASMAQERGKIILWVIGFVVKMAWVGLVVMGGGAVVMALSGVEMVDADQHAIFQYRMPVAAALIAGYLLVDYLLARRRARSAVGAASVTMTSQVQPKRGFAAELMALVFVAGGAAAFWHEHITHDIPNPVAVVGKFVSAACVDRTYKRIGPSIGPHMSIGYEFVSRSTSVRTSGMKCLLDNCEAEKKPPEYMDTEYKRVFYASLSLCQAALANVLELKAPTTLWTGDKDPNSAVRARFTSERDPPSYFLLWVPLLVAALVLLVSGFLRIRNR